MNVIVLGLWIGLGVFQIYLVKKKEYYISLANYGCLWIALLLVIIKNI